MPQQQSNPPLLNIVRLTFGEIVLAALCTILGSFVIELLLRSLFAHTTVGHLFAPLGLLLGSLIYWQITTRYVPTSPESVSLSASSQASYVRSGVLTLAYVGLAMLGSFVLSFLLEAIGLSVHEQSRILEIVGRGWGPELIALIMSAVVLAPIAEEWLLRGLLFRRLATQCGLGVAYVVSSVIFAAMHGNLSGFLIYMWLGLVFARCYQHTGRLWTAVLVHAGNNALTLLVLLNSDPSMSL